MPLFKKMTAALKYIENKSTEEKDLQLWARDYKPYKGKGDKMVIGAKEYYVGTCKEVYSRFLKRQSHWYEFWLDRPVCLFVDFDLKKEHELKTVQVCKNYVKPLIQNIKEILVRNFSDCPDTSQHFLCENSTRKGKISFHLKAPRIIFKNIHQQRFFWFLYREKVLKDLPNITEPAETIIDDHVYLKFTPLRLVWNSKYGLERTNPLKPLQTETKLLNEEKRAFKKRYSQMTYDCFLKYSVTTIHPEDEPYLYRVPEFDIPENLKPKSSKKRSKTTKKTKEFSRDRYSNYKPQYPQSELTQIFNHLSIDRSLYYSEWITVLMVLKSLSTMETEHIYYETAIEFSKQSKDFDKEELDTHWNKLKRQIDTDTPLYSKSRLIQMAKEDDPLFKYTEPLRDLYGEMIQNDYWGINHIDIKEQYLKGDIIREHLDQLKGEKRTIFLKSGQGTNKTGAIIEYLSKRLKNETSHSSSDVLSHDLLCCVTRRSLATTISERSERGYYGYKVGDPLIKIKDYKALKKSEYIKTNALVITPNSLIHLHDMNKKPPKYRVMWIDESKPFLDYLSSDNLNKTRRKVLQNLVYHIQKCELLMISDADLDSDVVKAFLLIRNKVLPSESISINLERQHQLLKDYYKSQNNSQNESKNPKVGTLLLWNKKRTDKNTYYIAPDYKLVLEKITSCLKERKNVYLCTDSKKLVQEYEIYFKDFDPLCYHGDVNKDIKSTLKDIDANWSNRKLIITNSLLEYGVSYDPKKPSISSTSIMNNYLNLQSSASPDHHFDYICGIFTGNTITAQGANQLLHRVRHTKTNEIMIGYKGVHSLHISICRETIENHLQKANEKFYTTIIDSLNRPNNEDIIELLTEKESNVISNILKENNFLNIAHINLNQDNNSLSSSTSTSEDSNIFSFSNRLKINTNQWFRELIINIKLTEMENKNSFKQRLKNYITEAGGKIADNQSTNLYYNIYQDLEKRMEGIRSQLKATKTKFNRLRSNALDQASLLSLYEWRELLSRSDVGYNDAEINSLIKSRMIYMTGISNPSKLLMETILNKEPVIYNRLILFRQFMSDHQTYPDNKPATLVYRLEYDQVDSLLDKEKGKCLLIEEMLKIFNWSNPLDFDQIQSIELSSECKEDQLEFWLNNRSIIETYFRDAGKINYPLKKISTLKRKRTELLKSLERNNDLEERKLLCESIKELEDSIKSETPDPTKPKLYRLFNLLRSCINNLFGFEVLSKRKMGYYIMYKWNVDYKPLSRGSPSQKLEYLFKRGGIKLHVELWLRHLKVRYNRLNRIPLFLERYKGWLENNQEFHNRLLLDWWIPEKTLTELYRGFSSTGPE